jgi:hypothetical protein
VLLYCKSHYKGQSELEARSFLSLSRLTVKVFTLAVYIIGKTGDIMRKYLKFLRCIILAVLCIMPTIGFINGLLALA